MNKKRLLILGATGMAGHVAHAYLEDLGKYEIDNIVFRTPLNARSKIVDVTNKQLLEDTIRDLKPDIILNCIGILIRGSQDDPSNAIFINSYLPHFLSYLSSQIDAKLIHISTDCVFSGRKGYYKDTDYRDADDTYGRSKALGEIINDKDLTIRTSIIGPEIKKNGEGLLHWFIQQKGDVNGYTDAFWGGVTTLELAKAISVILESNLTGLYQLSNNKRISKFDLLSLINRVYKLNKIIIPLDVVFVDKSIKCSEKDRFSYVVPSYEEMIYDLNTYMNKCRNIYSDYYEY